MGDLWLMLVLLILSGFFSGAEIAFFSIGAEKIQALKNQGIKTEVFEHRLAELFNRVYNNYVGYYLFKQDDVVYKMIVLPKIIEPSDSAEKSLWIIFCTTIVLKIYTNLIKREIYQNHYFNWHLRVIIAKRIVTDY